MSMSPETFSSVLQAFDPLLGVRWGSYVVRWVVDREAFIPNEERRFLKRRRARLYALMHHGDPDQRRTYQSLWRQVAEEDESAATGRRLIVMPEVLDRRVVDSLMWSDIRRYGGYSRMADEWDKQERAAANEAKRVQTNEDMARHSETFDALNFLRRRRSVELDRQERDLKVLLK